MRILFAILALLISPAAMAFPDMSTYRATLARPVEARAVIAGAAFSCRGTTCTAPFTANRPAVQICTATARRLGPVTAFVADDAALDPAALAKCNAAAE